MTVMNDQAIWELTVKEIDVTDDVLGGVDGPVNIQGLQLANRTQYLKQQLEALAGALSDVDEAWTEALGLHAAGNVDDFTDVKRRIFFFSQIM